MIGSWPGVLAFLPLLLMPSFVHAQRDPLQGLDAFIRQSMAEQQVPGLAIVVVKDNEAVLLNGYGVRELGKDAMVDEHTIFPLGSLTKAFTAASVGLLVDEGKLSWDDPVIQHLPWFRLPDPWVTRTATLRDLLSHRLVGEVGSGIRFLERLTSIERKDVLKKLDDVEPGPGGFRSRYQYCNVCYSLAGEVVEEISGSSWEDFVGARILVPLGMSSSSASVYDVWEAEDVAPCYTCSLPGRTVGFEDARVQNVAMPHLYRIRDDALHVVPWRTTPINGPAGSVSASATDVAKWLRLQLGKGTYDGEEILSAGVIEEMHTAQMPMDAPGWTALLVDPGFGHFWTGGFGWFLTDYHGRKLSFHSGGGVGHISSIFLMPEENIGVAVLTNSSSILTRMLALRVLNAHLGVPRLEWKLDGDSWAEQRLASERALQARRLQGTTPSLPIEDYVGEYWHPAVGKLTLIEEDATLVLRFPGAFAGDVEHWHHDVFRMTGRGPEGWQFFLTFVLDSAGQVTEFRMRELTFQRLPD